MDLNQSVPPLVDLAAYRIAILIFTEYKMKKKGIDYRRRLYSIARRKIRPLNIPLALEKKVARAYHHIGTQIINLSIMASDDELNFVNIWNRKLCWSVNGSINAAKTGSRLANDPSLKLSFRYELACNNCLEDLIDRLWEEMSDEERAKAMVSFGSDNDSCWLPNFWTCLKRGKIELLVSRYTNYGTADHYAFCMAIRSCNFVAMGYFWPRLQQDQKVFHLNSISSAKSCKYVYLYSFLFTKLTGNQQMELFATDGSYVLESFLGWGCLDMFSKAVPLCLPHLSPEEYYAVLFDMIESMTFTFEVISNFWHSAPADYRRQCVTAERFHVMYLYFVESGDEDMVQMVLRELSTINRKSLFRVTLVCSLRFVFRYANWPLLELLAYEMVTSSEDMCQLILKLESLCDETRATDPVVVQEFQLTIKPRILRRLMHQFC